MDASIRWLKGSRIRSPRPVLLLGFGTLLILIGLLALSAFWRADRVYSEVSAIHEQYRDSAAVLDAIHTDVYRASLLLRDYLIDPEPSSVTQYRRDLLNIRMLMKEHLAQMDVLTMDREALGRLHSETSSYLDSMSPIFNWTLEQKAELGFKFLRSEVRPRRESIILLTQEINRLNALNLATEQAGISNTQSEFRRYLGWISGAALFLGLLSAGISFTHITRLERRSEQERRRIELAEHELRLLSQKLVQAQEEERRSISRELHDEIGQMLTGLRLELRNLEELHLASSPDFAAHLAETKELAEKVMRAVRDLAMGLRPSMLDDLGLAPALQWQAREFSRHNGIPATVEIDGDIEDLSEALRTCVYRVVQESLTNCARHAKAKNVRITVHGGKEDIVIAIRDDGVGFKPGVTQSRGMGLMGMEERVRELSGIMKIWSQPRKGTVVEVAIPWPEKRAS
jgi:signal transduction histidine kinase